MRSFVKMITCRSCGSNNMVFVFDTETDTGAIGFVSAARCNGSEIVVAEATWDEWKAAQSTDVPSLLSRMSRLSGVTDLHMPQIKRIEEKPLPPAGMPFPEWRNLYKRPVVIYACPCCADGEATVTREVPRLDFENMGGRIIALDGLVVEINE